ncbi:MAG: FecR family protein [Treponema sp.]|nr:FecR family protein [Treponema sp.]
MKKTIFVLFLMLTALYAFAQNGVVRELSGEVEVKHSGSANFTPARVGEELRADSVISTGFRSSAAVQVGSAFIAVRPLTRLSLSELSSTAGQETINVNLQAGRVRVDVNPPAGVRSSMQVTSPSATASVRGTSFDFDTKNMDAHTGLVQLRGTKGPGALARGGFSAGVDRSGRASYAFYNRSGTSSANILPELPPGMESSSGVANLATQLPVAPLPPLPGPGPGPGPSPEPTTPPRPPGAGSAGTPGGGGGNNVEIDIQY